MVILSITLVPFFYRAKVFTAYEYLEKRFDGKTRTLAAVLFLALKYTVGLRPSADVEKEGLDIREHGERAYNM